MRTFIISDLHGNGEVYDSIMAYLENVALIDDVELYINGDLIDRGIDSFRMLEDVYERVNGKGSIKIHYLGGNHELMMYQALKKRKPGKSVSQWCDWMNNGGWIIEGELDSRDDGEEKMEIYKNFLGNLKIYHKFSETIQDKPIILVHAQPPKEINEECNLSIDMDNHVIFKAVWMREDNKDVILNIIGEVTGYSKIGKDGYFVIVGHTPISNSKGFYYNKKQNYLNIDGCCSGYAIGEFEQDHVPLVEICNNYLDILVFNHNNQINEGYKFDGEFSKISDEELEKRKIFIDHSYDGKGILNKKLIKELLEIE